MISIVTYMVQATIGLGIAFILIYTVRPDLFPGIGVLLTMGYGMGPGLAYSIGHGWEQYGFTGGGQIGLTFAAIGYLFAFFGGIGLIRYGIKKGKLKTIKSLDEVSHDVRTGIIHLDHEDKKSTGKLTMAQEAIDSMSFQLAMVGMVYLATYWVTRLIAGVLPGDLANTLWSFHFIVAILVSLLTRWFLDKINKSYMIDEGLMNRVNGVAIDFLVVAAIAAISIPVLSQYWLSVLLISAIGGLGTVTFVYWASYRAYNDYPFERFVSVFAEMTGTINSALTLIRVMDPHFKTIIAEDNILGSAIAIGPALPMLIIMNFPTMFWADNIVKGWMITWAILAAYTIVLIVIWRLTGAFKFKKQLD
jgi:ESS family glutamate:Na+ symporter